MEFSEYSEYDLNKKINLENIKVGIGLNKVDNLNPSIYFYQALNESQTYEELEEKIIHYYANQQENNFSQREKECDLVSQRIAKFIDDEGFSFSPMSLKNIHKKIFDGVFREELKNFIGVFRKVNISKGEEILNGKDSVVYADYNEIDELLHYDFMQEKHKYYANLSDEKRILNIATFVSNIWQIHPFREGNTRIIAVFAIKYINSMGFNINNDMFKEHSKYFRNALVLANYSNIKYKVTADFSYLESFFKKLLSNEKIELKPMPKCLPCFLDNFKQDLLSNEANTTMFSTNNANSKLRKRH
ncbi:Fic family protein [Helicobacter sp. MIT 14-3879]|uniref:Fic family protein n=1 Tax=Helicobacter sp. MIT 14-3879 TaxID=2040649 RepID=UPI000E1E5F2C|nr:Fic family protein [Helicobacter sp. MIT 14-3879]RDU61482.1 cell filamentation protein Fic [Helicobacter sp. MIT 14-3879]